VRRSRAEKALVGALAAMYVRGVSTRKAKAVTEELHEHSCSASAISRINATLQEGLAESAGRRLEEPSLHLVCDARYERVREGGVIRSRAVLVAIGVNTDGHRCVPGVEAAARESATSRRDFPSGPRARGLAGVELVVGDAQPGLRKGIAEILPAAA
jgi:putative transposase